MQHLHCQGVPFLYIYIYMCVCDSGDHYVWSSSQLPFGRQTLPWKFMERGHHRQKSFIQRSWTLLTEIQSSWTQSLWRWTFHLSAAQHKNLDAMGQLSSRAARCTFDHFGLFRTRGRLKGEATHSQAIFIWNCMKLKGFEVSIKWLAQNTQPSKNLKTILW